MAVLQSVWVLDLVFFWVQAILRGEAFHPYRAFMAFENPRFMNQVQSWLLPVATLLCLRVDAKRHWKVFFWTLLIASWCQLWLSMGRGTLVGLTLGFGFAALLFGRDGRRFAMAGAGSAAAGFALYALFFRWFWPDSQPGVFSRTSTSAGRFDIWGDAWRMFLEAPLLGKGPQAFGWGTTGFRSQHNTPLQLLSEWGLIGTAAIGGAIVLGVMAATRFARSDRMRGARRHWVIALTVSCVSAAGAGLFSGLLIAPMSQLGALVVLALWIRVMGIPRAPVARMSEGILAGVLTIAVALGLLFPDLVLPFFGRTTLEDPMAGIDGVLSPRFWVNGI